MFGFYMDQDVDSSDSEDEEVYYRHLARRREYRRSSRNNFERMILDLATFLGDHDSDPYHSRDVSDDDMYQNSVEATSSQTRTVRSLLDTASVVVAKNCSCEFLESAQPPLDEGLLKKVAYWAFPQNTAQVHVFADMTNRSSWDSGEQMVNQNKIREMWQVGFMATAYITKYSSAQSSTQEQGTDIRVSLTFERRRIVSSSCSECRAQVWCQHIIAAIIYRIKFPEKVKVHAPMTETLSTLDRTQLQKLLQYAVQEDPAGILGKVFKHLDEVRDTNSDMNKEQGAPDPTFGYQEGKTQWELSLESFMNSFQDDLNTMCRGYYDSSTMYPTTFDLSRKVKSRMFRYLKKVLELTRRGEPMLGVEALARVTKQVITKLKSNPRLDSSSLAVFCHDLIHTYTMLALSPHQDKDARSRMLELAMEFTECKDMRHVDPSHSEWAELPSIAGVQCYGPHRKWVQRGHKGKVFKEPLAALCVDHDCHWPPDLVDLVEGRVTVEESPYDEDVRIMLARLETLMSTEPESLFAGLGRLASKVLRKLQQMALKESIIGQFTECQNLSKILEANVEEKAKQKEQKAEEKTFVSSHNVVFTESRGRAKGKGKRQAPGKGKGPANKKRKTGHKEQKKGSKTQAATMTTGAEDGDPPILTKGQLTYGMLYTIRAIIVGQKTTKQVFETPEFLAASILLTLELSRHRTTADPSTIKPAEHDWLLSLENMLSNHLSQHWAYSKAAISLYLDAFMKVGMGFYDGCYPFAMLDELFHLTVRNETLKVERVDDLLSISSAVLIDLQNVLDRYQLPNSRLMQARAVWGSYSSSSVHKDFMQKKLQGILQTFISTVNEKNPQHVSYFTEVLEALQNIDSTHVLKCLTKALRTHAIRIWSCKPAVPGDPHPMQHAMETSVRVILRSLTKGLAEFTTVGTQEELIFLGSLLTHLGTPGLKLLLGTWSTAMSCANISTFVLQFREEIQSSKTVPKVVVDLVREYITADLMHGSEVCRLLDLFKPNDANYNFVIETVMEKSKHFQTTALFELAQAQLKHRRGENPTMDMDTLAIVEKAFENQRKVQHSPVMDKFIDWLCLACMQGSSHKVITKRPVFAKMLEMVASSASEAPEILLRVLENLEKMPALMKSATPVSDKLLEAYKSRFDQRVYQANHSQYNVIIKEMLQARQVCKRYIKDGGLEFDNQVVKRIRTFHSGKKKLMRMLKDDFGVMGK